MNIETQYLTATHDAQEGLTIYSNKDGYNNPFWKGVVVDDTSKEVVARSFQGSNTIVTEVAPDNLVYVPLMESTVLRFYRHHGQPMVSTHRQVNVANTASRIGNGKTFITLVKEAIQGWEDRSQPFIHEGLSALAYTPTSWEDLCVDGWCHVFLLVDVSNQKTNLTNIGDTPLLLHALSLSNDTPTMTPHTSLPIWSTVNDTHSYTTFAIPTLPLLSPAEATQTLLGGGAVVGYNPISRDIGTKYLSPSYSHKIKLANETTNPIHRWHELMDMDEKLASEYLKCLPTSLNHMNDEFMVATSNRYVDEAATFITQVVVDRYSDTDHPVSEVLEKRIRNVVELVIASLKRKYSRGNKRPDAIRLPKVVYPLVREELLQLSYAQVHTIRGRIMKENKE
jgi:hypothetical protein